MKVDPKKKSGLSFMGGMFKDETEGVKESGGQLMQEITL